LYFFTLKQPKLTLKHNFQFKNLLGWLKFNVRIIIFKKKLKKIFFWYFVFKLKYLKILCATYLFYKALCLFQLFFSVCSLSVLCPANWLRLRHSFWFLLNEDWHFSLWNLNWNLNWKRTKIIFHFLIWPQMNLSFCSDIRTSYLLKRKLGINTQHKRCYTYQRSLTKNKFTKVKVFPLSNIVI